MKKIYIYLLFVVIGISPIYSQTTLTQANEAYGQEGCIIFNPKGIGRCNAGDRFRVNITGAGKEICYEVNFF